MRYDEDGRYVVCSRKNMGEVLEWTPKDFNARTLVHEYGGGSFMVHEDGIYFSNFKDQRLYHQKSPTSAPDPVSPDGKGWRYADGQFSKQVPLAVIFIATNSVYITGTHGGWLHRQSVYV